MLRSRKFALVLIVLYTAFLAGANFHVHTARDQARPDCNLCQGSHTSLVQTVEIHCSPEFTIVGSTESGAAVSNAGSFSIIPLGRAPPLS